MSRLLSLGEKDAVCSLLSVRSNRKRLLDSGDSESSDSYSQSGSSSQCKDTSNSTESDPDGRASKETFQFQHIIDFDPATMDRTMRKPVIKKKMVCECGAIILTRTEWKHKQTNKHIQFILQKRAQQEQGPSRVQNQVHTPLPVQQRPSQEKQKQKRYRESPPPVSANLGGLIDSLPAEPQPQPQPQPPLQQQQHLPPASLRSHDHTGPLSMQKMKMQDTHTQIAQHSDLAASSTSIFTEMYSRNPHLPPFGSSRHMDLGQQTSDVCSSQRPYNVGMRERGLAPHYLRIDQPEVYDSIIGGWHHAFQPQTPLGDRRISELGQQQPQWYIAAPLHQRQCNRIPMAPETRFFDSDYSASLSNFPIHSFY